MRYDVVPEHMQKEMEDRRSELIGNYFVIFVNLKNRFVLYGYFLPGLEIL